MAAHLHVCVQAVLVAPLGERPVNDDAVVTCVLQLNLLLVGQARQDIVTKALCQASLQIETASNVDDACHIVING